MNKIDDFGLYLKHERELRGIPLEEIANATKIHMRFLKALEDNEFDAFPGEVFIKGYIRSYAKSLGADAEEILSVYDDCVGKGRTEKVRKLKLEKEETLLRKRDLRRNVLTAVVVVGVVLAGFYAIDKANERQLRAQRAGQAPGGNAAMTLRDRRDPVSAAAPAGDIPPAPFARGEGIESNGALAGEEEFDKPEQAGNVSASAQAGGGIGSGGTLAGDTPPPEEKTLVQSKKNAIMAPISPAPKAGETSKPAGGIPPAPPSAGSGQVVTRGSGDGPGGAPDEQSGPLPLNLSIRAKDNSWFNMVVDGSREMDFILPAGSSKTIPGRESLKITIGNKQAVELTLNGRTLTLPSSPDNVVRDFLITKNLVE
ncbi:MAG: helix-turn-helix domain-containing protein [Nitrospinae bacterium]|nr:helix-turn-helix domain-containing protein [Nitrospinota bacterium]